MKRYRVTWANVAASDAVRLIQYIARQDGPNSASKILDRIESKARQLETFPTRGRIVPELKGCGISAYHELIIGPWRLIYRIEAKTVLVLALVDGRRDVADVLFDRFMNP